MRRMMNDATVNRSSNYPNIIQSIGLLIAVSLLIVNLIAIGLALMWAFRKTGAPFAEVFPLTPTTMSFLFPMALTVVGGLFCCASLAMRSTTPCH